MSLYLYNGGKERGRSLRPKKRKRLDEVDDIQISIDTKHQIDNVVSYQPIATTAFNYWNSDEGNRLFNPLTIE